MEHLGYVNWISFEIKQVDEWGFNNQVWGHCRDTWGNIVFFCDFIKIGEFWKVGIKCGTSLGFPTNNMEDATFLRETALYHRNVLHRYENTRASKSFMQEMILTSKNERRKKNSQNTLFRPTTIVRQNDFQQYPIGKTCDFFCDLNQPRNISQLRLA